MFLTASGCAFLAAGCGSTVSMDPPTIPVPLLEPMQVSVGVRFPDNFEDFTHEEEVLTGEQWTIHLGRSNAVLCTELFGYMFQDVTILGPEATLTDALSTSIFVMGPDRGLELINRLDGIDAIVIDADGVMRYSAELEKLVP